MSRPAHRFHKHCPQCDAILSGAPAKNKTGLCPDCARKRTHEILRQRGRQKDD
jgi:hypothetical protein